MSGYRYVYGFPENRRARAATPEEQAEKLLEEAFETKFAHEIGEDGLRVCEEAFDTITAAEGMLRKYPRPTVDAAYELVMEKGDTRGDWL